MKLNSTRYGVYHLFYNMTLRHRNNRSLLGLVHTSDVIGSGVGIGSARNVTIQCESKIGIGSEVGSSTESESEG